MEAPITEFRRDLFRLVGQALEGRGAVCENWTRDPFARMIVAQAKANGLAPLVFADEEIGSNYARTVW